MDTHDISEASEYFQRLQEQKKRLRNAQSRKGERPPAQKPRLETILQFRLRSMKNARKQASTSSNLHYVGASFVPSPYPPCVSPFRELAKTVIDDLLLETRHRGKYLLRCITPQDRVMVIVEDEKNSVLLQLYHQEQTDEPIEDTLVEGGVLIVKEPYLKFTSDGGYGLRVDHVSDIEFLSADDDPLPSSTRSDRRFRYTQALRCFPTAEEFQSITLNRSLAFLKTKSFDATLSDIQSATNSTEPSEKGMFREFKQLYAEASRQRPPHLGHATYIGPVVVKESRVFAHVFVDESSSGSGGFNVTILIDAESDRATMGSEPELINMLIRKLHRNPSLATAVTDLHHGSYEPVEMASIDGVPVVDSFLIRRIIALNSFGCPLNSRSSHLNTAPKVSSSKQFHSSGIWAKASYINHSCISNARRSFIGDLMIPPRTEQTSYLAQQKPLLKNWGFTCKCAMCRDMRDTPDSVVKKRKQLREGFRGLIPTVLSGQDLNLRGPTGMGVLKKAEAVLVMSDLQLVLSREYKERMQPVEAGIMALAALKSFGFVIEGGKLPQRTGSGGPAVKEWGLMTDNVVDCWIYLRDAYCLVTPGLAVAAEGYAKTAYRICIGEDETLLDVCCNLRQGRRRQNGLQ
ncbi:TPR domain protein [Lasiosphaeria hispida]|uniref:TPR domain protein n=1 Tax=Lasiosphaeria hispida TaxID=260671 RepID=A0AAJ0MIQ6_9PEZI|nr:TPR domain protein [Lasiosphaeria hispida]